MLPVTVLNSHSQNPDLQKDSRIPAKAYTDLTKQTFSLTGCQRSELQTHLNIPLS